MKFDVIKDKIEKIVYPISVICVLYDSGAVVLSIFNLITLNIYICSAVILVQFFCITVLFVLYRKLKSLLYLYETFANNRVSLFMAIKFILNLKGYLNFVRIDKVSLQIKIVNIPEQRGNILDERYDCRFTWDLEGRNVTREEVDKLYFRLSGDNSINLDLLQFEAYQCQTNEHRECKENVECNCLKEECSKHIMKYNKNDAVQKSNFFILPLEFKQALKVNEDFKIKTCYTWLKCYNALVDYLIIDPYNFSTEVKTFEVLMKIDGLVITEATNARVCYIVRNSAAKREIHGIETLDLYIKNGEKYLKSRELECDNKNIYFVEITK